MHSLIAGIANSFIDNLIAEQRYRMILDGLQVTLLITFCAAVFGTLLGGVVCWARMSRKPWLRQTAKIYIDLMRGTSVLVREFIRKAEIRLAKDNYVFAVATYGFLQGFVCEDARHELKRKGIKMNAGYSVKMPDNWTPMFDLSNPAKVQQQVDAAEPQIDEVIAMIKAGTQGNKSHDRMPYFFRPFTDRLLTYERQTKFFAVDKNACIGCGLCAKKCPVQAIEMQETAKTETNKLGKNPVWTAERCALCLGCLHRCPKFAISYNNKTQSHGQYQHSKYYKKG